MTNEKGRREQGELDEHSLPGTNQAGRGPGSPATKDDEQQREDAGRPAQERPPRRSPPSINHVEDRPDDDENG
jgi:hypothetical protein